MVFLLDVFAKVITNLDRVENAQQVLLSIQEDF